jgi:hypothetical protein
MVEQYLLQNFAQLQNAETDVGITVGKSPDVQTFPGHKLVLNQSPYFKKIISFHESENNGNSVSITMPDITPKLFVVIYR